VVWHAPAAKGKIRDNWTFKISCIVKESFPCTYFALICYDDGKHGGYGGVQTLDSGKHALIFSVWDGPDKKTKAVESSTVDFGGEGTGQKCLVEFPWRIGDVVTQKIEAKKIKSDGREETWHISSSFNVSTESSRGGQEKFMSTYEWTGYGNPTKGPEFYSFIEDWDRRKGKTGHLNCRKADFFDASVEFDGFSYQAQKKAFTKVEHGPEKLSMHKVVQEVSTCGACCTMSTGRAD